MRAQSAARSAAMEAFAHLKKEGFFDPSGEKSLPNGVTYRVEMVLLPPEDKRGEMLLVKARGQSGPVSSYYTLHLEKSSLASQDAESGGRVLFFTPKKIGTTTVSSGHTTAVYGDYISTQLKVSLGEDVTSYQGPVFSKEDVATQTPPFYAQDWPPIFVVNGSELKTSGPAIVAAPPLGTNEETSHRVLTFKGDSFEWDNIDPPTKPDALDSLSSSSPPPSMLIELKAGAESGWTNLAIRGIDDKGFASVWKDIKPGTQDISEAQNLGSAGDFVVGALVDWSSGSSVTLQEGFVTRGAIAAYKNKLYSHGWHYLYRRHNGNIPSEITAITGSQLTRWPCVLVYDHDSNRWDKAWAPLDNTGNVKTEWLPDPTTLLVDSVGNAYTRSLGASQKLLTLETNGQVQVGSQNLSQGHLFLYQDTPHLVRADGLVNLKTGNEIGFDTLVSRIPEIYGPLSVPGPGEDGMVINYGFTLGDADNGGSGAPIKSELTEVRTVRLETNIQYSIPTDARPAVDGNDLWIKLDIQGTTSDPSYDFFGQDKGPEIWNKTALARYDGQRWHILPHGLRALVDGPPLPSSVNLTPPSGSEAPICARYNGLPGQIARYAVVSIDTNPFEFK